MAIKSGIRVEEMGQPNNILVTLLYVLNVFTGNSEDKR